MAVEWWEYGTKQEGGVAEWLNGIEEMERHTVDSIAMAYAGRELVVVVAKVVIEQGEGND